jgi:hypothetical protein
MNFNVFCRSKKYFSQALIKELKGVGIPIIKKTNPKREMLYGKFKIYFRIRDGKSNS